MENKNVIEKKVTNVLEQIRPYLQADGGDIRFVNLTDDMTVNVELQEIGRASCRERVYTKV